MKCKCEKVVYKNGAVGYALKVIDATNDETFEIDCPHIEHKSYESLIKKVLYETRRQQRKPAERQ